MKRIDLTGHTAGTLTITGPSPDRKYYWRAVCTVCTKTGEYRGDTLRGSNPTARCECRDARISHGALRKAGAGPDPLYTLWQNVRARVRRQSYAYPIELQDGWQHFSRFRHDVLRTIGPRPSEAHSLDRIDVMRGYLVNNIRWATPKQQANNRTSNRLIKSPEYRAALTVAEWAQFLGAVTGDQRQWAPERVQRLLDLRLTVEQIVSAVHPQRRTPQELAEARQRAFQTRMQREADEAFAGWDADL